LAYVHSLFWKFAANFSSVRIKMKLNCSWQIRLAQILLGAAFAIALVLVHGTNAQNGPVHLATDWSHRHLIFSAPKNLVHAFQLSSNARYVQQWVRRNAEIKSSAQAWRWRHAPHEAMKGDWSMNMGTGAKVGQGQYPAKFSFDVNTASCATDFVVYNTSLAGSNAAVAASAFGTFTAQSTVGSTIVFTNPTLGTTLTMTPGIANAHTGAANSGTGTYVASALLGTQATNLTNAIQVLNNGSFVGVRSPSHAGATTNFQAITAGTAGNSITITNSAGSNFTPASIAFTGGANGQASIMAFNNLYASGGCTAPTPKVYWAYNTSYAAVPPAPAAVVTSPVISLDGTQVAFVQNAVAVGSLVLLKWKSNAADNFNNPTDLTGAGRVTPANYPTCTAPCMTTIAFSATGNPRTDNNSSPFYDYVKDTIYVGDDGGRLRKFTNVFNLNGAGTAPAEATAPWPVTLTGNVITTSPVHDQTNSTTYIADAGGFLYSVTDTGVKVTSARIGFSLGIVDSPTVDPTAGMVYAYVSNDSGAAGANTNHSGVFQFPVGFAAGATGTEQQVGDSSGNLKMFAGDFDNTYFTSPTGTAGFLYVCGNQAAPLTGNQVPTLWQIPITNTGAMGAAVPGPALTTAVLNGTSCSPVVEVYNPSAGGGAKDWIFMSVVNNAVAGAPINCGAATGCIMSFDVTLGAAITAGTTTTGHTVVTGGASAVTIDNLVGAGTTPGASQVYFTPLGNQACTTSGGNGGCAIQASQSALN
jgi:hypothetical protein